MVFISFFWYLCVCEGEWGWDWVLGSSYYSLGLRFFPPLPQPHLQEIDGWIHSSNLETRLMINAVHVRYRMDCCLSPCAVLCE